MGTIHIEDLKLRAIIGTQAWERNNRQDLIVTVVVAYDARKACQSDNIKDALDYAALARKIKARVSSSKCLLLEKLAAVLLKDIMADKRVCSVKLCLQKPLAIAEAKAVTFELSGFRD